MTNEELDARCIPRNAANHYNQLFRNEQKRDVRKKLLHAAHPIMGKMDYLDVNKPEVYMVRYDMVMDEYNKQRNEKKKVFSPTSPQWSVGNNNNMW